MIFWIINDIFVVVGMVTAFEWLRARYWHVNRPQIAAPIERKLRRDDYVIYVSCDGCMASDHKAKWIGMVQQFGTQEHGDPLPLAYCMIIKRFGQAGDWRDWESDADVEHETVVVTDKSLQFIAPGLWMVFK